MAVPLTLSQTRPDFDRLVLQLQIFLQSRASWIDLLPSGTGETLIEMMAAVGTFNQFAVENAARESFLTTAVRDSSIYAITRMLGVRISRKGPASVLVSLARTVTTVPQLIQPYTQFTINGQMFFNRDPIVFAQGSTLPQSQTVLYEGQVRTQSIAATSTQFTEIKLNEPGFVVSDVDVNVSIVNPTTGVRDPWSATVQGIWNSSGSDKHYYDSSLGDGDTVLSFGDGYHGALPGLGNNIEVQYVVTKGSVGNNSGTNLAVAVAEYSDISGTSLSGASGGSDEKAASYYKILAPSIYKARSRAVTPIDYKAIVAGYTGVASCMIRTQKDIAPNDLRWMNVVQVTILPQTGSAFSTVQWDDFEQWFKDYHHAAVQIQRQNPTVYTVNISLELALMASAVAEDAIAQVDARIRSLFVRDITTLGRRIARSDIVDACAIRAVDYTDISVLSAPGIALTSSGLETPNNISYFELGTLSISARYSERTLFNEAARRLN